MTQPNKTKLNALQRDEYRMAAEHVVRLYNGIRLNRDGSFQNTEEFFSPERWLVESVDESLADEFNTIDWVLCRWPIFISERLAGEAGTLIYEIRNGISLTLPDSDIAAAALELARRRRIQTAQGLDLTAECRPDDTPWTGDLSLAAALHGTHGADLHGLHSELLSGYEQTFRIIQSLWDHITVVAENLHDEVDYIIPPALATAIHNRGFFDLYDCPELEP